MRKKQSFLDEKTSKRKFDAFNIISNMMFIGLLVLFIFVLSKCISDMINAENPSGLVVPLIMRLCAILLTILPYVISRICKLNYPKIVMIMYYLFLFLSLYLGTFLGLYIQTPLYNRFVHAYGGLFLGIISMFIVRLINKDRTKRLHPMLVFLFVFVFSMGVEACWEIWEFTGDKIFGLNMQVFMKDGIELVGREALKDTMFDIICNSIGAIIGATICAISSYKFSDFIDYFKITKKDNKKSTEIEEIEE